MSQDPGWDGWWSADDGPQVFDRSIEELDEDEIEAQDEELDWDPRGCHHPGRP